MSWTTLLMWTVLAVGVAGCDSSGGDGASDDVGAPLDGGGADGSRDDGSVDASTEASGDGAVDTGVADVPAVEPADGMTLFDVGGYPAPPVFDPKGLPKDPSGRPILLKGGQGEALVLETIDPPPGASISWGPLNEFAGCQKRLLACVSHYKKGALDSCMSDAHCMGTAKPSDGPGCCPTLCWNNYVALRGAGVKDVDAAYRVFFRSPRCITGLDDALGGRK